MKTSDSTGKLWPAFLAAQKAITFAVKEALNPAFRTKYADLGSVIDAVKEALNTAGISFIQSPGEYAQGVMQHTTRLVHESGEWVEGTMGVPVAKADAQGLGSAITYARRYHLAAMTGLYQDDDDGTAAVRPPKAKQEAAPPKPPVQDDKQPPPAARAARPAPPSPPAKSQLIPLPKTVKEMDERVGRKLRALAETHPDIHEDFAAVEREYLDHLEPDARKLVGTDDWRGLRAYFVNYLMFLEKRGHLPAGWDVV